MSNLSIFNHDNHDLRSFEKDGQWWFPATDLLSAMRSSTTVTALKTLVQEGLGDGYVINQPLQTSGGEQIFVCLSESALTYFVSRSRTEAGKKFNRWIHSEVLPSIRKTGSYSINPEPEVKALPERDTVEYIEAAETLESLPNSTLKALLRDSLVDELELQRNNKLLPGTKKRYTIVKVRAKELGYTTKEIGKGTGLGKFVAKQIEPSHKEGVGRYSVNHFEITPELDMAIHQYFGRSTLTLVQ